MTRVAVTTASDGSGLVAGALAGHGLEAVLLPCISVKAAATSTLDLVRRVAAGADLILLTSARAVWIAWPEGGMPPVPVAAVGMATAQAAESAGGSVVAVGLAGAAELVAGLDVEAKHLVFPHARTADPSTRQTLVARGATVLAFSVYETRPVAPGPDRVEAALFGSPLAVAGWSMTRSFDAMVIGAIGETTARALSERGVHDVVIPDRPRFAELARALSERITR